MKKPNKNDVEGWINELCFMHGVCMGHGIKSQNMNDIIRFLQGLN